MTTAEQPSRPLPRPTALSAPFWAAARAHRLVVQECAVCGNLQHYPRPFCVRCAGTDLGWHECSGRGTVYSFTVVRQAASPAFAADVPYLHAIVQLDEGPHMTTLLSDLPPEQARVGMPVVAAFQDVNDDLALITFRPVERDEAVGGKR